MASPSPPFGQKRHLKLHTVKAKTLLKLVALIYSGEVEVNVGVEQNELLAAAVKFGITDLVEGQKQDGVAERCHQRVNGQSFWDSCQSREGAQDAQVQADIAVGKTASALDWEEGRSEHVPAQNVESCVTLAPQNLNVKDNSNTLCSERIPSSGLARGGDPELNCTFNTDCATPWPVNMATTSFDRDSNGWLREGGGEQLQSPARSDMMESESEDQDAVPDVAEEGRTNAEQPKRAEVPEVERAKSTEERSPLAGRKNLELIKQMAQMVESTQISIKVKSFSNTLVSLVQLF